MELTDGSDMEKPKDKNYHQKDLANYQLLKNMIIYTGKNTEVLNYSSIQHVVRVPPLERIHISQQERIGTNIVNGK